MPSSRKKQLGLGLVPRRRHMPLKRYKVRAISPIGEIILIVRARSKKNARFLALQDYVIIRAEVLEILGLCKEEHP